MKTKDGQFVYVAGFDFDGTIGRTFESNRDGIGVNEAYQMASSRIFGPEADLLFSKIGGLKNRPPRQFVEAVLQAGCAESLITAAKENIAGMNGELEGFMPDGLGGSLEWKGDDVATIAEAFVRVKLGILLKEIGTSCAGDEVERWPRICKNFLALWRCIALFNKNADVNNARVVPVIISSGHHQFISECFKLWGLAEPVFMVTDDIMRSPTYDRLPQEQRAKPDPYVFRVFLEEWLKSQGEEIELIDVSSVLYGRGFFAGDCEKFDRGLATNVGLPFLWFNPGGAQELVRNQMVVEVRDWIDVIKPLLTGSAVTMMGQGLPMSRIIKKVFL